MRWCFLAAASSGIVLEGYAGEKAIFQKEALQHFVGIFTKKQ